MPCWNFFHLHLVKRGLDFNMRKKDTPQDLEGSISFMCSLCLGVVCVGISKVFIVSKSILPSSKLLVQAKKKKTIK